MTLGQRIQKGRKEAGLSQEELAEQLGVSRQAVSRWGIWRAYRLLTMNEEYWRRKKKK